MRTLRLSIIAAVAALSLAACFGPPTADVGDCMQLSTMGTSVDDLPTVECSEPHEGEVFAVQDTDYDGDYSLIAVEEAAGELCATEFETYVGTPYAESEIWFTLLLPDATGWGRGDRQIICIAYEPGESGDFAMVTGSVKGSNR